MYFVANKVEEEEERLVSTREGQQAAKINKDFFKEISVKEMSKNEFSGIIRDLHEAHLQIERSPKSSPKLKRRKSVEVLMNQIDVLISDELTRELDLNRKSLPNFGTRNVLNYSNSFNT